MSVPSGPWLLIAANLIVVLAALGTAGYLLRRRRGVAGEPDGWYAEAAALAGEVGEAAAVAGTPADLDAVSRRLLPLAARIQGHVRAAPTAVDGEAHHALFQLGAACRRVAMEHRPVGTDPGSVLLEDRLSSLRSRAVAVETLARDRADYSKPRENTVTET